MLIWDSEQQQSAEITVDYLDQSIIDDWNSELEDWDEPHTVGYYWAYCLSGCLPSSDYIGSFETVEEAIANAREDLDRYAC